MRTADVAKGLREGRYVLKAFRDADGTTAYGHSRLKLPTDKPGRWLPRRPCPALCRRGWHGCRPHQAALHARSVWVLAEIGGKVVEGKDKLAAERMRLLEVLPWDEASWRADVAEHVLPIYEAAYPDDDRPRRAIEALRRWGLDDNRARAAAAAAAAAANAAAYAATYAAAYAASAATYAATYAASDAASAATYAASDAASAATYAAERRWQSRRLMTALGLSEDLVS